MTAAMPWVFASLGSLMLGVVVVAFWQSVRAAMGLVDTGSARSAGPDAENELFTRKRAVLEGLRELDFDHQAGKLSDEDHARERERLRAEAVIALRAIDAAIGPYRAGAEASVAARLAEVVAPAPAPVSAPAPVWAPAPVSAPAPAPAPAPASVASRPSCPACATENDVDATFCKRCGAKIAAEAGA